MISPTQEGMHNNYLPPKYITLQPQTFTRNQRGNRICQVQTQFHYKSTYLILQFKSLLFVISYHIIFVLILNSLSQISHKSTSTLEHGLFNAAN